MTRPEITERIAAHLKLMGALASAADGGERIPCAGHPETWDGEHPELQQAARFACASCDQIAACLLYVTAHPEAEGVWAGLTPTEQKRLHREGNQ